MQAQHFAQQRQGDRALLFEGVLIEGNQQHAERAHVARDMAQQVGDDFGRKLERAFLGQPCDGGGLFIVGQRQQTVDQAGAQAGAQVFA